jgi:hypothetical protein
MRGKQKNAHLLDLWKNGLDVIVISEWTTLSPCAVA